MNETTRIGVVAAIVILGSVAMFRSCVVETTRFACVAAVAKGDSVGKWGDNCRSMTLP